jgi:Mce-associated membrane protein
MSVQNDLEAPPADAASDADVTEAVDSDSEEASPDTVASPPEVRRWQRIVVYGVVPALALVVAAGAGWLKWLDITSAQSEAAAAESVQAARESTVAMLSYQPDNVQQVLESAQSRMTGDFRDSYGTLIHDVVIPGAKEQKISAVANVPAAASISATRSHATVIVFVNQTSIIGSDPPVNTASTVRMTLDKVDGRWLVSGFDPI